MLNLNYNRAPGLNKTVTIDLPGSKSISNRFLILNKITGNKTKLVNLSESRDTAVLKFALESKQETHWFEDGATPFRFFLAYSAAMGHHCVLDGTESLRNRSMKPLVSCLVEAGASIDYLEKEGFAPIRINSGIDNQSNLYIETLQSSQFASALMLIAPLLNSVVRIKTSGNEESISYVQMTVNCLAKFGCVTTENPIGTFEIDSTEIKPPDSTEIESDWSSSSYFYAVCACLPGSQFKLMGLKKSGTQGDEIMLEWGARLGVKSTLHEDGVFIEHVGNIKEGLLFDFSNNIDLAPTIICTFAALQKSAYFTGMENLKYKESSRLEVMIENLNQLGIALKQDSRHWYLEYSKNKPNNKMNITTHKDHRMAMAFSVFAIEHEVAIDDFECVVKSFPGFWNALKQCNFALNHGT